MKFQPKKSRSSARPSTSTSGQTGADSALHKVLSKGLKKYNRFKPDPALLLHPQIPKPMHLLAPRVVLGEEWWSKTRHEAKRSTGFRCAACGGFGHGILDPHECYEINYRKGQMVYIKTVPLCRLCHGYIHLGRLIAGVAKREITKAAFDETVAHGTALLVAAGLTKPPPYTGPCAAWKKWRLVIDGKEYPPVIKSEAEWLRRFGQ